MRLAVQVGAMPYAPTVPHADAGLVIPDDLTQDRWHPLRWALGIALVVILATVVVVIARRPAGPEYRTAPVERRTIVETVEATGYLDVLNRFQVPSAITGRVLEVFVTPGTPVKSGDPLARLDEVAAAGAVRGSHAALRAATSRVSEAEAALAASQDTLTRVERLAAKGLASPSELAQARAEAARSRAALRALRAERSVTAEKLSQAEHEEDLGTLRAPIDGVVLISKPVLGAAVSPETGPLFVIGAALEKMRLWVNVAEADIGRVRVGQTATFRVPAFPNRVFSGKVERVDVDGERNGTAVTYPVTLEVDNPGRALLPAMTATTTIEIARAQGVLSVREASLRLVPERAEPAATRSRVWVLRDGGVDAVTVTPGISDGSFTEVKVAELREGDQVAIGALWRDGGGDSAGPGISLGRRQ